jgi:Family of unknown function (DUF5906)/Bifunctional DNA primase/polymerase, N-terminal
MKATIEHPALKIARDLLRRGWNPVFYKIGDKNPTRKNWQKLKLASANVGKFCNKPNLNIGIQMGPNSNDLVDVDLDCQEGLTLADYMAPPTGSMYGRAGKPRSHRLYTCACPEARGWVKHTDDEQKVMVELRLGGMGKGAQSVAPGSVHPCGELYRWDQDGEPAAVDYETLKTAVERLAVGCLLMRHWPLKGALHDTAQCVGGFLARAGWTPVDIRDFVYSICRSLPDITGPKKHAQTAFDSAVNFAKGGNTYGMPQMTEVFGQGVADKAATLVHYHKQDTSDEMAELNEKYCVVLEGSKVRVLTFHQQHGREMVSYLTFSDFRNLYMNKMVVVGKDADENDITVALGSYWLKHSQRRQYSGVVFEPCKPAVINGKLNLWRGWGIEPQAGDWSLMQQHIGEVLASGESEHAQYIRKFAAWCVQHPDVPAEVALVFKGREGTGRGIFGRALCRIFGQHAHQISSIKHLTGTFNAHLRDCCMLFADEAFWPGFRNDEGTLKRIITEPTLFIEPKGLDASEVVNRMHVIMVSNNKWVIPASIDARRFAMFEVAEHHMQDAAWFKPLYAQMEEGGYAAMLHDLLQLDLGDWHPREIIRTDALYEQQMLSLDTLDPVDAW